MLGQVRSGQQTGFVNSTSEKFAITSELEFLHGEISSFRVFITVPVLCVICISVTWGQVRTVIFTCKEHWKIMACVSLRVNESIHPIISGLWWIIWSVMTQMPFTDRGTGKDLLRPCEVINSHWWIQTCVFWGGASHAGVNPTVPPNRFFFRRI